MFDTFSRSFKILLFANALKLPFSNEIRSELINDYDAVLTNQTFQEPLVQLKERLERDTGLDLKGHDVYLQDQQR